MLYVYAIILSFYSCRILFSCKVSSPNKRSGVNMSETALKFGPEWVRALSHGGSVNSPPPSPGLNKYKVNLTSSKERDINCT